MAAPPPSWVSRVSQIQNERLTPALRASLLQRAEASAARSREVRSAVLSIANVQSASNMAFDGMSRGLREARHVQAAEGSGGGGGAGGAAAWAGVSAGQAQQMQQARRMLLAPVASPAAFFAPGAAGGEAQAQALDAALAVLEAGPVEAAAAEGSGMMADLLRDLRVEPAEAELATKFELFTAYLSTVELLRDSLLEQWRVSRQLLPEGAAQVVDRGISKIDAEGMGAQEEPGVWLVHGMAQTASANHGALSRATKDLETKLRLCQEPGECPMCLEACGGGAGGKPEKVLACCHKACLDCWVRGGWVVGRWAFQFSYFQSSTPHTFSFADRVGGHPAPPLLPSVPAGGLFGSCNRRGCGLSRGLKGKRKKIYS